MLLGESRINAEIENLSFSSIFLRVNTFQSAFFLLFIVCSFYMLVSGPPYYFLILSKSVTERRKKALNLISCHVKLSRYAFRRSSCVPYLHSSLSLVTHTANRTENSFDLVGLINLVCVFVVVPRQYGF